MKWYVVVRLLLIERRRFLTKNRREEKICRMKTSAFSKAEVRTVGLSGWDCYIGIYEETYACHSWKVG